MADEKKEKIDETFAFKNRDIISIKEFTKDEIVFILKKAKAIQKMQLEGRRSELNNLLKGKIMASLFFEVSTRTRSSFDSAMKQLGGTTIGFSSIESTSVQKGETITDTVKMYDGYGADVFVMRHPIDGSVRLASDVTKKPVINGGDGSNQHPTQTLLDLFTIHETQGRLDNLRIALCGDLKYGRTVHSLVTALSLFNNNKIFLISPESLRLPTTYLEFLKKRKIYYKEFLKIEDVINDIDILYMTRIQKERFGDPTEYEKVRGAYSLKRAMLKNVKKNLKVLHPLPRDKNNLEIDFDVDNSEYAYYHKQAENGLYVRQALLTLLLTDVTKEYKKEIIEEGENFISLPIKQLTKRRTKPIIFELENGTVIDHIKQGFGLEVVYILGLDKEKNSEVIPGLNLNSKRYGKKDILKIVGKKLSPEDLNKIAIISPNATISIIHRGRVVQKGRVTPPNKIIGTVECPNLNCVSRKEHKEKIPTIFYTITRDPIKLRCHYCERIFGRDEIKIL